MLEGSSGRLEDGARLVYAESEENSSGLVEVEVDEAKLNAAVFTAVRKVLYE